MITKITKRPRVGIIIDYSIRIPMITQCFTSLKEAVVVGIPAGKGVVFNDNAGMYEEMTAVEIKEHEAQEIKNKAFDFRNFWNNLNNTDPAAADFYFKIPVPKLSDPSFDVTLDKYFFNKEHKLKFLNEYSYTLFGQGAVTNKNDIEIINIAQTKLCDVVLIDIAQHTRKIPNTFAFLSRAGVFVKEVRFIGNNKFEEETADLMSIWNPYTNQEQIILPATVQNKPTEKFISWFEKVEKDIKASKQ